MGLSTNKTTAVLLVGGRSSRMGTDKFLLAINGTPQWKYMLGELQKFFDDVYISCRTDQAHHFGNHNLVYDQINDIGPMGAIFSAFQQIENADQIFFVSCDLPNFNVSIAQSLFSHLATDSDGCAAQSIDKDYPEPLVAFWSRKALPHLATSIHARDYALFKLMKNLKVHTVSIAPDLLKNVNRKEDL